MDPSATFTNQQVHYTDTTNASASEYAVQDIGPQVDKRSNHGWRRVILNLTPSWFSITMGTGIVSILTHKLSAHSLWLYYISTGIFALNIVLFTAILLASILRYIMFPGLFTAMLRHPVQSLFVGTLPMGLPTIINMIVLVCVPTYPWTSILAWVLWWIDAALAVAICFSLPFFIIHVHTSDLTSMTAAWLLPIAAPIVASATGSLVAETLPSPHALSTLLTSYILLGTGFPLALTVLVIYFQRLAIHNLPPREVIVSVFLPLGPIGQASFSLMHLGKVALAVFPRTHALPADPSAASVFYTLGHYVALVLWGYGLVWLFFALASISVTVRRRRFPFNMGWWGFTFPLGVYATATLELGEDLPSGFFYGVGVGISVVVVALWCLVAGVTVWKAGKGVLFVEPGAGSGFNAVGNGNANGNGNGSGLRRGEIAV